MIKKFIDKLLGKSAPRSVLGKRVEIGADQHGIAAERVDERAVRVVRGLADAGFEAYVVGGAVRDLLLGLKPKDFDVATDATPEQVKSQFKRAFIIGRRFRIVHVVYGRGREHEVIEVSTFRALLGAEGAEQVSGNEKTSKAELAGKSHVVDAEGRVLRDNVWGPQIEDAARRDFTVNAMYYDPQRNVVVDYHGGVQDAAKRVLRIIGDAETRYREDPVRIIRAVRFAAKLGFEIEPRTRAPIKACAALLANVPASRLFDEMIKLLQTGHSIASLAELRKQGLARGVFPILDATLDANGDLPAGPQGQFVRLAFEDTDRRVAAGRGVSPSFMLAAMLWREVKERWTRNREAGEAVVPALAQAIDAVFDARIGDISGRGKLAADMREIWMMQPRFERRSGSGVFSLVEQPRFRAGYDFLRLRADAGEVEGSLADWWDDFAQGNEDERAALLADARETAKRAPRAEGSGAKPEGKGGGRKSGPRTHQVPRKAAAPADAAAEDGAAADGDDAAEADDAPETAGVEGAGAPARKRRRRRKPRTAGGAPAAVAE
ncbi:MAG: polynucleotide adenylyltransferase PcnB [Pelomonas sp.]|nr:polynucleotide adenylyltransferase PcnB [Roseateles sp.]